MEEGGTVEKETRAAFEWWAAGWFCRAVKVYHTVSRDVMTSLENGFDHPDAVPQWYGDKVDEMKILLL